jgi:hypothetical protein
VVTVAITKTQLRVLARSARQYGRHYVGPGRVAVFCPLASRAGAAPERIYVEVSATWKKPRASDFDRAVIEHLTDSYSDGRYVCAGRAGEVAPS